MALSIIGNNNGIAVDGNLSVNHIDFIPGQGMKSASGFQQKAETVYAEECKEDTVGKESKKCAESSENHAEKENAENIKDVAGAENIEEEADSTLSLPQLTNRQIVIMMSGILDLTLSKDFTNQTQLAIFLSRLTGRSAQSIRQTIINLANRGANTIQAQKDYHIAADALEPINKKIASKLRNDAEE